MLVNVSKRISFYLSCFFLIPGDKMSQEDAEEFIKLADTNGDGKIDYKGKSNTLSVSAPNHTPNNILFTQSKNIWGFSAIWFMLKSVTVRAVFLFFCKSV